MCGFPVYSYGQRTISLWFYNSVQEGDGTILLVVHYCKPYGRVNTVYVLKEALFVGFLVDLARNIKESIYIRVNNPSLNNNIGKFNLSHIWDRVLLNTKGLTLK